MNATKKERLQEAIEKHGRQLLAIFPNATDRDPVSLCKRLRRLEAEAAKIGLRMCNGPEYPEGEADKACDRVLSKVNRLLRWTETGGPSVFVNRDPRGYALKIDDEQMRARGLSLHSDWGGYGIIAPDLSEGSA